MTIMSEESADRAVEHPTGIHDLDHELIILKAEITRLLKQKQREKELSQNGIESGVSWHRSAILFHKVKTRVGRLLKRFTFWQR